MKKRFYEKRYPLKRSRLSLLTSSKTVNDSTTGQVSGEFVQQASKYLLSIRRRLVEITQTSGRNQSKKTLSHKARIRA